MSTTEKMIGSQQRIGRSVTFKVQPTIGKRLMRCKLVVA